MRFVFTILFLSFFMGIAGAQGAGVNIPAGQTFILGEYRAKGYRATLQNVGNQAIVAAVIDKASGEAVSQLQLNEGDREAVKVADGQEVHLINTGDRAGKVRVKSPVAGNEGMSYVGNDEAATKTKIKLPAPAAKRTPSPETETTTDGTGQTAATATLEPGQTFIIGEGDAGDFNVTLINRGSDLEVSGRTMDGGRKTQGFGLGRFGEVEMTLRPNEALYLVNNSGKRSTIKVKMNRAVKGARVSER